MRGGAFSLMVEIFGPLFSNKPNYLSFFFFDKIPDVFSLVPEGRRHGVYFQESRSTDFNPLFEIFYQHFSSIAFLLGSSKKCSTEEIYFSACCYLEFCSNRPFIFGRREVESILNLGSRPIHQRKYHTHLNLIAASNRRRIQNQRVLVVTF